MNPNGCPLDNRPTVTPTTASGTMSQITNVFFMELNRPNTISTINPKKMGK